jgi:hemolysin III
VALAGLVWLVMVADTTAATVAAWVYGLSMVALYLASGTYHVFAYDSRFRSAFRRLDHSMIFVLIAGSATPVVLLALDGAWRWWLLAFMWAFAVAGIVLKVAALERYPRVGYVLYIVLGWSGLVAVPAMLHRPGLLALIAAAGIIYTIGAVLFALRWPRLSPTWFGFHEVWHVMVVAAGALLFAVNINLVSGASA